MPTAQWNYLYIFSHKLSLSLFTHTHILSPENITIFLQIIFFLLISSYLLVFFLYLWRDQREFQGLWKQRRAGLRRVNKVEDIVSYYMMWRTSRHSFSETMCLCVITHIWDMLITTVPSLNKVQRTLRKWWQQECLERCWEILGSIDMAWLPATLVAI